MPSAPHPHGASNRYDTCVAAVPTSDRLWSVRDVVPDYLHPLIPEAIRAKIEAIEPEARAKGWPAELLWNNAIWDLPRGIAAVLDAMTRSARLHPITSRFGSSAVTASASCAAWHKRLLRNGISLKAVIGRGTCLNSDIYRVARHLLTSISCGA